MVSPHGEGALTPERILDIVASSLNGGDKADVAGIKNAYEAVALVGHACMIAVGFRLVGLGEEHQIAPGSTSLLPMEWNATSTYPFRYAHSQSSMQYLLKLSRLGNNAVVFALALGDDKTTSFDLPVKDYISSSTLPLSQSTADLRSALPDVFISTTRLQDLIGMFKVNVIQKLAPGLHKEGYEGSNQASRAMPPPNPPIDPLREYDPLAAYNPLAANPGRPVPSGDFPPPGFEDAYDINRPPGGFLPQMGGRNPLTIGDGDLYPPGLGPHDPIRGTFGPRIGRGSGMHPTFDDPLFGGRRDEEYNPQVPPGARYDPVGPGDGPPFGRGRNAHGPGGFFGGGFGGDII